MNKMKRKKWISWVISISLLWGIYGFTAGTASASSPHGIQFGHAINDSGTILLTDQVAQALADTGTGWVRLNFRLGPHAYDTPAFYSTYDTIVNSLRSRGIQIIGLFTNESLAGGQADWTANNYENEGGDGYNAYIDQFGYMAARVAAHYEEDIHYWEIWNEPNCYATSPSPGVYEGCSFIYPSNFAALLAHVWTQLRYYNNLDVQVVSGGLLGHDIGGYNSTSAGATYLTDTYEAGINVGSWNWIYNNAGQYPLDHIGQHIYIDQGTTVSSSSLQQYLTWVRNAYTAYEGTGTTKKTFMTEIGWETDGTSEADQASNITTTYQVMNSTSYVQIAMWFYLQDEPGLRYGLYRTTGLSALDRKPSWTTYNNAVVFEGKTSSGTTNMNILNYFNTHGKMTVNGSPFDNGGSAYVHWWDYGYLQDFDGGSIGKNAIMTSASGTFQVKYGFWQTYLDGNYHHHLKFPTSDEYAWGGGTRQDFQGGYMTWTPSGGIVVH